MTEVVCARFGDACCQGSVYAKTCQDWNAWRDPKRDTLLLLRFLHHELEVLSNSRALIETMDSSIK